MNATSAPARRVQPARRIAYEILAAVRESDAYANLLLTVKLERARLSTQDAAFATELTFGTLRRRGYYDAVIAVAASRAPESIDAPLLDVLRVATHQLLSMRVAAHAAVDEAVTLAREVGSRSTAGFVNAVLRTITRSGADEWRRRVLDTARNEDDRLALEHSHPLWIVRAFRRALAADGRDGELEALLMANNEPPRVGIVALPGLADREELGGEATRYSPFGTVLAGGDPSRIPAVGAGRARVQDEGSQLAALALTRVRAVSPGERWLDMCSGPGGKAALLAAEGGSGGASLVANEIVPGRAELVRGALRVFSDPPRVMVEDGVGFGTKHPGEYDRILLDAPCTGLGALRRRPEARWRKAPSDVAELSLLQSALLESAFAALKPGGVVAYVTCSPHLGETRDVVNDAIVRAGDSMRLLDTASVLERVAMTSLDPGERSGSVQLWPQRHGTDAMFIALLEKRS